MKLTIIFFLAVFTASTSAISPEAFGMQYFLDRYPSLQELLQQLNELYNNVQQVINGILTTGTVVGRSQIDTKGLWDFITDAANVIYKPIDNLAISLSGMLVHVFAGIAAEGLPAPGRRSIAFSNDAEAQKFLSGLYEWAFPTINSIVQSASLSIAQVLLTVTNEGLAGLLPGKRQIDTKGLFDSLYELVFPVVNPLVQSVSLSIAQTLLDVTNGGLAALLPGKRQIDTKGLWDFITDAANVIYKPIDNLAISLSGMLVHVFAGIAAEGLPAPGRR